MRRTARKLILLGLVALVATLVVAWPSVMKLLAQRGLERARENGVNLSWNGLTTGHASLGIESLIVWIPGPKVKGTFAIPVSLELQQLSLALRPSSLLTLTPSGTYATQIYGGTLSGDATTDIATAHINATIDGAQLGKHPQLASIGFQGGVTNGTLREVLLTPRGVEGGAVSLQIREFAIPAVDAVRTLLRTDNIGTVDIDVEGTISPSMLDAKSIRLSSLFGSLVGSLSITDHLSRTPSVKGSFIVSLSENGTASLGPWLPLIPNAGFDSSASTFEVSAISSPCSSPRSSGAIVRLGSGCLKLTFEKR
jgi:hypothetical protein